MRRPRLRALVALAVVAAPVALYTLHASAAGHAAARATATARAAPVQLFVSPGGSVHGHCSKSRPCSSLGAAYRAAGSGTTMVTIAAGRYPLQTIEADASGTGAQPGLVAFRPASPGTVALD